MVTKRAENILLLIFFLWSTTNFGIPIGTFKLIISDVLLLFLFSYVIIFGRHFKTSPGGRVKAFVIFTIIYFLGCFISIINVVDFQKFINALLPWAFTFLMIFVSYKVISVDPERFFLKLRKVLIYVLLFINLPAYLSLAGLRVEVAFDPARYQGFTFNPNQYISFVLVCIFLLIQLELKFRKGMRTLNLMFLYALIPVLMSGSKTGLLILLLLQLYFLLSSFMKINFFKKSIYIAAIIILIQLLIPVFESFRQTNWSVDRAVKTYDIVMGNEKVDGSTESRFTQAAFGQALLAERPLLGVGLGNFMVYFEENEVHNSFLSTLYECGVLGFTTFILLLVFILFAMIFSPFSKKYIYTAVGVLLLFLAMNTFHIYFRERWVWFYLVSLMFLFTWKRSNLAMHPDPLPPDTIPGNRD